MPATVTHGGDASLEVDVGGGSADTVTHGGDCSVVVEVDTEFTGGGSVLVDVVDAPSVVNGSSESEPSPLSASSATF